MNISNDHQYYDRKFMIPQNLTTFLFSQFMYHWNLFLPIIFMILALVGLIIIPQKTKLKHSKLLQKKIEKGRGVTTQNGMRGTVHHVENNFVIVQLDNGRKIEIIKQGISTVNNDQP